jgi:hypothetical protein
MVEQQSKTNAFEVKTSLDAPHTFYSGVVN